MACRLNFSTQAGDSSCAEIHPAGALPGRANAERSRPLRQNSTEARDLFQKTVPAFACARLLCPSNVSASSSWTRFPSGLISSIISEGLP